MIFGAVGMSGDFSEHWGEPVGMSAGLSVHSES